MSRDRYRKGTAIVWFALLGFVLLGFVGLSLDWGKAGLNVHELHNGADASALAGAQMVKFNQEGARQMAIAVALENNAENLPVSVWDNPGNDPNGELVLGRWINQLREFIPTLLSPNAVRVVGRRLGQRGDAPPLRLNWGPIFHTNTVAVSRYATAVSVGSTGAGIICLADDPQPLWNRPTGLWLRGNGPVDLSGYDFYNDGAPIVGDIQVNATADSGGGPWEAVRVGGTVEIDAAEINVVGATNPPVTSPDEWEKFYADPTQPPSITASSPTTDGAPRVDDPLKDIPQPEVPPIPNDKDGDPYTYEINEEAIYNNYTQEIVDPITGQKTRVLTLEPGYYPGGIHLDDGTVQVQIGTQVDPDTGVETPIYETINVQLVLATGTSVEDSVYALGGGTSGGSGLVMTGGAVFGEGVTLFITGEHDGAPGGTKYGQVYLGGNAAITLSAPGDVHLDSSGKRQIEGAAGVSIWQDRNNTNEAKIIGTSDFNLSGTLYFSNNHTEIGGTGFQAGNQLITGSLDLHGTGVIGIAYDGRGYYRAFQSMLVE